MTSMTDDVERAARKGHSRLVSEITEAMSDKTAIAALQAGGDAPLTTNDAKSSRDDVERLRQIASEGSTVPLGPSDQKFLEQLADALAAQDEGTTNDAKSSSTRAAVDDAERSAEEFVDGWYNATRGETEVIGVDLQELTRRVAVILGRSAQLSTRAEVVEQARDALEQAEACMSIVEPRSDKAEYLRILGVVRAALRSLAPSPKEK